MTLHSVRMTFLFFIISKRLPKTGQKYEDRRQMTFHLSWPALSLISLEQNYESAVLNHFFSLNCIFEQSKNNSPKNFHASTRLFIVRTGLTWKLAAAVVEMLRIVTHFTRSYDGRHVKQGSTFLRSSDCFCGLTVCVWVSGKLLNRKKLDSRFRKFFFFTFTALADERLGSYIYKN